MKSGPEMQENCFNKTCVFHLKTGETIIGGVIDDANDTFTVEVGPEKIKKKFPQSLVHSYDFNGSPTWRKNNTRSGLLGKGTGSIIGQVKTKKLIIFGAGASYDFKDTERNKIPLTNNLFEENVMIHNFPGALKLKPKILTSIESGQSLEEYFEEKWAEIISKGDTELLNNIINTQFYIQNLFRQISQDFKDTYPNNYTKILWHLDKYLKRIEENELPEENIAVVTFNYDTLLEDSLSHMFDYEFKELSDYTHNKVYKFNNLKRLMLFKPHGSWNWIHKLKIKFFDNRLLFNSFIDSPNFIYKQKLDLASIIFGIDPTLENSDNLLHEIPTLTTDNFRIINYSDKLAYEYYPNLLIPFKHKDQSLMPRAHENLLSYKLETVEEILIIGWKGTEDHFNVNLMQKKLKGKKVRITYVSPNSQDLEKELKKYLPLAEFRWYKGGFSEYLNHIKEHPTSQFNFFNESSVSAGG